MNKIINITLAIIFVLNFALITKASDENLSLGFAENCTSRDGCVDLTSKNLIKGDRIVVDIVVKNPNTEKINSVSSWVKYNPSILEAISINTDDSVFDLASPDGNKIDEKGGIVQIGRGSVGGAILEKELYIASITFEATSDAQTFDYLEFFNYQESELGNTGVFSIDGILISNLLKAEPTKLKLTFNGGGSENITPVVINVPQEADDNTIYALNTKLSRPQGVRIQSKNSSVNLQWDYDENVEGYFVYYSTNSGVYLFRQDIGKTNYATISNLKNNQKYFFAVSAYSENMTESDFSDEVYATVGVQGSESHPFVSPSEYVSGGSLVDPNNQTTQETGSKNIAFFALALAVGGIFIKKSFSLLT